MEKSAKNKCTQLANILHSSCIQQNFILEAHLICMQIICNYLQNICSCIQLQVIDIQYYIDCMQLYAAFCGKYRVPG